jgi:AAA+ ATPase superfamily predicted ATPase
MTFEAVSHFREGKPFEDRLMHYAVAGGMPAYWVQFSPKKSFSLNVKDHVLTKGQVLYEEVEFLLREELREPRYYFALLQAIAQGKRKQSEIINATGLPSPVVNKYLGILSDLHIVEREIPITEDKPLKSKKGLYKISDEFCQFWFKNIFPRKGELEMDMGELVLEDIKASLPSYLSFIYEKIAKEILIKHSKQLFPFTKIGRWWEKNEEIDIIGLNPTLNKILFCEVKWTTKRVGLDVYESLQAKSRKVVWGDKKREEYFCLFSKQGFTDALISKAQAEEIYLFKGEEFLHI